MFSNLIKKPSKLGLVAKLVNQFSENRGFHCLWRDKSALKLCNTTSIGYATVKAYKPSYTRNVGVVIPSVSILPWLNFFKFIIYVATFRTNTVQTKQFYPTIGIYFTLITKTNYDMLQHCKEYALNMLFFNIHWVKTWQIFDDVLREVGECLRT